MTVLAYVLFNLQTIGNMPRKFKLGRHHQNGERKKQAAKRHALLLSPTPLTVALPLSSFTESPCSSLYVHVCYTCMRLFVICIVVNMFDALVHHLSFCSEIIYRTRQVHPISPWCPPFLSRCIMQDPVEKYFGLQRQRGRVNENPNVS